MDFKLELVKFDLQSGGISGVRSKDLSVGFDRFIRPNGGEN